MLTKNYASELTNEFPVGSKSTAKITKGGRTAEVPNRLAQDAPLASSYR